MFFWKIFTYIYPAKEILNEKYGGMSQFNLPCFDNRIYINYAKWYD